MGNKTCLFVVFFMLTNYCLSQAITHKDRGLYIIKSSDKPPISTENYFIDPDREIEMEEISELQSGDVRRILDVDRVFVVTLMPKTKILTFDQLMNLYKISGQKRNLPVSVDGEAIRYPETILISQNQIDSITIKKNVKGLYLSIILTGYYDAVKEGNEERRRGKIRVQ